MKALPIQLDRLLSNPSFEQVRGKLLLVSDDRSRIIIEFKGKKVKTLFGPFPEVDWQALLNREVVAFVKPEEITQIYDLKTLPREAKASVVKPAGPERTKSVTASPSRNAPVVKWGKYAEARPVGEAVKLVSMERGFGLEAKFLDQIFRHLGLALDPETRALPYLDFRKVYKFLISPEYKTFQNRD